MPTALPLVRNLQNLPLKVEVLEPEVLVQGLRSPYGVGALPNLEALIIQMRRGK